MALSCATAEDVLKTIKDEKVQMIDLRFTDLPGVWQHFSVPPSAVDADALDEGIGFDGSSIRDDAGILKCSLSRGNLLRAGAPRIFSGGPCDELGIDKDAAARCICCMRQQASARRAEGRRHDAEPRQRVRQLDDMVSAPAAQAASPLSR
jgi:glutamine synthetase